MAIHSLDLSNYQRFHPQMCFLSLSLPVLRLHPELQGVGLAKRNNSIERFGQLRFGRSEHHSKEVRGTEARAREHENSLFFEKLLGKLPVVLDVLMLQEITNIHILRQSGETCEMYEQATGRSEKERKNFKITCMH